LSLTEISTGHIVFERRNGQLTFKVSKRRPAANLWSQMLARTECSAPSTSEAVARRTMPLSQPTGAQANRMGKAHTVRIVDQLSNQLLALSSHSPTAMQLRRTGLVCGQRPAFWYLCCARYAD